MLDIESNAIKWEAYSNAQTIQHREILVIAHYLENLGTQVRVVGMRSIPSLWQALH